MDNKLAENMLRFGVKNLSDASKKKLSEQTSPLKNAKVETDRLLLLSLAKSGIKSFVGKDSAILYVPTIANAKLSTTPINITAYIPSVNVYTVGTYVYPMPILTVAGNIDIRMDSSGAASITGMDQLNLNPTRDKQLKKSILEVNTDVLSDAQSWNNIVVPEQMLQSYLTRWKNALQLNLAVFANTNETTKAVFFGPNASSIVAAKNAINTLGGTIS